MSDLSSLPVTDHLLSEILALSRDATAIYTGEDIVIRMANDQMIGFWGKDRSIIGQPIAVAVPELAGQEFIPILQNVWRTGTTYQAFETPAILRVNGHTETFYFDFTYRALLGADGEVYCILHTAVDVTQKVKLQSHFREQEQEKLLLHQKLTVSNNNLIQANKELTDMQEQMTGLHTRLADSEGLFQSIFAQAPLGLTWLRGPDMIVEQVNEPILRIWGRTAAEVMGKPIRIARPELEGQTILDRLDKVYHTGIPEVNAEYKVLLKEGQGLREAYVNSVYSPLRDGQGTVQGILVIIDEVTDRIRERQQRELLEEQFRISVESADLGTWFVNLDNYELISSPRLRELFGFHGFEAITLDQAIGQIREDYRDSVSSAIHSAIENETSYDMEYPIIGHYDQKLKWVRATGKIYPARPGAPANFSGVLADITDRKLEEKRKHDFIGIASHELKTPLTSAKAYVQFLLKKRTQLPEMTIGMLEKVERQIEKMHSIITGFLDVARLESSEIRLYKDRFLLNELVEECLAEAALFTSRHELKMDFQGVIPVTADRDKIGQVINNFLSNAVKYSPNAGSIVISCRREAGYTGVYVTDSGIGVQPADQERLFTRFYRVESQDTQTISGFGIGLYLCAEIIRLHDGIIGMDSEPGAGSTFYFKLPHS
ncbi:PAS domain-containing sensor histidine kinase [Niabella hibiscisoli]|uniref:PAS domain-containing sensor histidine kinase n=1 Tax=Niabella hibiscisoli TaxID=1825928 RepID=UPI001F0E29ED|nr:ATP-binding protein [Niabella hibiscisoli]MCH5719105.1 ATP-binding protein [Niabella hibiscisoli]